MQRLTRGFAIAATTFFLLGLAIPAGAASIVYAITQMTSGTLGSKSFTNVPVTISLYSDTSSVVPYPLSSSAASGANTVANNGTAEVTIPGVGVAVITQSVAILSTVTSIQGVGSPIVFLVLGDLPQPPTQATGIFFMAIAMDNSLLNYDLRAAFALAALPASVGYPQNSVIHTNLGDLTFAARADFPPISKGTFSAVTAPITPQVGLWWNPDESGSGYALDYKHGVLVVTTYSYNADGSAQWYLSSGPVVNNVFTATLDKYTNGQCISCSYTGRPSGPTNDGSMTITFSSANSATVKLPGGRVFQIQPQPF